MAAAACVHGRPARAQVDLVGVEGGSRGRTGRALTRDRVDCRLGLREPRRSGPRASPTGSLLGADRRRVERGAQEVRIVAPALDPVRAMRQADDRRGIAVQRRADGGRHLRAQRLVEVAGEQRGEQAVAAERALVPLARRAVTRVPCSGPLRELRDQLGGVGVDVLRHRSAEPCAQTWPSTRGIAANVGP